MGCFPPDHGGAVGWGRVPAGGPQARRPRQPGQPPARVPAEMAAAPAGRPAQAAGARRSYRVPAAATTSRSLAASLRGVRSQGPGARGPRARGDGASMEGASRGGAWKAEPVVADTSRDGVSEDANSSSRLALSAASRTRSRKDSGRTGRATRAGGRSRSPVPRTRCGKEAGAWKDGGCCSPSSSRGASVPARPPSGEGSASAVCPSASGARRDRGGTLRPFPILLNPPGGCCRAPSCGTAEHTVSHFST